MPGVGKKADAVADRSGVPLLYNHACLYQSSPLLGGKGETPFPDLKYSAPAPCRSGSKGEAPWSPKAKSRFESSIEAQERELAVVPGDALGDHVGFLLALL